MPNLGWNRELEDTDYLRNAGQSYHVYGTPRNAPASFDPRTILRVEDQGQMNSCTGHGGSSGLEACIYIDTAGTVTDVQMSRMFAYVAAQKQSGIKGDNGATITGLVESFKRVGCCREETLPYTGRYSNRLTQEQIDEAGKYRIVNHSYMKTYAESFDWMSRGMGPIVIGITWFYRLANTSGVITTDDLRGPSMGGHCVLLWGWSERQDNDGRNYIWLLNSHGVGWGLRGWAEVHPDVIDAWGASRNSELIGISDLTSYDKPRRVVGDWGRVA